MTAYEFLKKERDSWSNKKSGILQASDWKCEELRGASLPSQELPKVLCKQTYKAV